MLKKEINDVKAEIYNAVFLNTYTPYEAVGWPPGLKDFVQTTVHNATLTLLNNIYSKQELDSEVESILLDVKQ